MSLASGRLIGRMPDESAHAGSEEVEALARQRIEHARIDLLLDYPYFAAALLAIPMRGTSERAIPYAVATDGSRIAYRYDLVAALERPRVKMLLMHALIHALLQHPERCQHRDWTQWTSACDIAVDLLFEQIGIDTLHGRDDLRRFAGKSAEEIYALIQRGNARSPRPAASPEDGMLPPPPSESFEEREVSAGSPARDAFERAMDGAQRLTQAQVEGMRRDFRDCMADRTQQTAGSGAGCTSGEIDAAAQEQVCWRTMLARFMREPIDREWSLARPNRKHIWRGLYLPGPVEVEGGRFVLAIDTSGSMSDHDLSLVLGEVDAIRRSCACEMTVLQFDAAIHAKAEFGRWSEEDATIGSTKVMRVYGRGGTDLRLPFVWAEEERKKGTRISALIVCTDGFGPLPSEAPAGLPVLFMLTPQHDPPKFGEQIVLGVGQGHRAAGEGRADGALQAAQTGIEDAEDLIGRAMGLW
jgi:predicted metal-dependent peptidase